MAGPASRSRIPSGNVNDSSYSRILEEMNREAKECRGHVGGTEEADDEGVDNDGDPESVNGDSWEGMPAAHQTRCLSDAASPSPHMLDVSSNNAQGQKTPVSLRGGAGSPRASDTASIRSSTRRTSREPGFLERLLLPVSPSHRSSASRSHASVRPSQRRRSAAEANSGTSRSPEAARSSKPEEGSGIDRSKRGRRASTSESGTVKTPASRAVAMASCVVCMDELPELRMALLKCKHRMCNTCLRRSFTLSTTDPQLMPPKCCDDNMIPLHHVDRLFKDDFKILWNRKFSEYNTKNRLYCPKKGCGIWIKPKYIGRDPVTGKKYGTCKQCKTKVCKKCGVKWHGSRECENDESTQRVLELGREEGWQRCYNCKAMVQLSEGCNHMKCRCNAEFCMLCAKKWKTCSCSLFAVPAEMRFDWFMDRPAHRGFENLMLPPPPPPLPPPPPPPPTSAFGNPMSLPPPPPVAERRRLGNSDFPPPTPPPIPTHLPHESITPPGRRPRGWPGTLPRASERGDSEDAFESADSESSLVRLRPGGRASKQEQEAGDLAMARQLQELEYRIMGVQVAGGSEGLGSTQQPSARRRRRAQVGSPDDDFVRW